MEINISQIDTLFVNGSYPIEILLYYKQKIYTKSIRKALKKTSSSFWPLFGKYSTGKIQPEKYIEEKFYQELSFDEDFLYPTDNMLFWSKYNQVNPQQMTGLFFLTILQFNNGTVLIPKMNHLAGDGYSYFYFLSVLAALAKPAYVPFKKYAVQKLSKPFLDRTVLKQFKFNKTKIEDALDHPDCKIHIEQIPKRAIKQDIRKLKETTNKAVSANDILAALVLKKTFEYQKTQFDKHTSLTIPIDVRRYVKELGSRFFGNGIMLHTITIESNQLEKLTYSDLALELRESIPKIDSHRYLEYLTELEKKIEQSDIHTLKPYAPHSGCLVTNLSRMPLAKLNFGTGNPAFTFLMTIGKNSAAVLADNDNYILRLVY